MNVILKFDRVYHEKYNTSRINIIENGILVPKEVKETKYGYRKAVVQLAQPDLPNLMEVWETQINEYLKGEGITPIKIVYGNKIYPKTKIHNPNYYN